MHGSRRRRRRLVALAAAAAACVVGVAGWVGRGASATIAARQERFDPAAFGDPTTGPNQWFPLRPGYQSVRQGAVDKGHRRVSHLRVFTVTDVSKPIAGVRTVAVLDQDIDGGQISEQALDYLAQDRKGNVWYLGSYTESYEGGRFVAALDGWLAGVRGARAGILVPGRPRVGSSPYYQQQVPGLESTAAQVVKTGQSTCVPLRCFRNVLVIEEGGAEYKYFARGVGGIRTEPVDSGGDNEVEALVNLKSLTPRGLAELSAEAVKLDRHARVTMPDVFGHANPAKRTL